MKRYKCFTIDDSKITILVYNVLWIIHDVFYSIFHFTKSLFCKHEWEYLFTYQYNWGMDITHVFKDKLSPLPYVCKCGKCNKRVIIYIDRNLKLQKVKNHLLF